MAEMFIKRTECPCCLQPAHFSRDLFSTRFLGFRTKVLECKACNLVYKDLAPTEKGLQSIYGIGYVHHESNASHEKALSGINRLNKCIKFGSFKEKIKLLDVGCGSGDFVEIAASMGIDASGIDPFLPLGHESTTLSRKSIDLEKEDTYDVITALNVAEHLVYPNPFMSSVCRALRPGGVFLLTCPWGGSLHRRVFQDRWSLLSLEEHLLFWSVRSLKKCLRNAGFLGKCCFRIGGAPFPIGCVSKKPYAKCKNEEVPAHLSNNGDRNQYRVSLIPKISAMDTIRFFQRTKGFSSFSRFMIDKARIGSYLDFYIIK